MTSHMQAEVTEIPQAIARMLAANSTRRVGTASME